MVHKVGVCWFDDPGLATDGWASLAGEEARRVRNYSELENSALWVTNIDYRTYRRLNLLQSPTIFDSQYFRTSLRIVAEELSLTDEPDRLVEVVSAIFTRLVKLGQDMLGVSLERPAYRYVNLVRDVIKPSFARKRPDGSLGPAVTEAARQAYQANQAMSGTERPEGSQHHSVVFPRGAYADWLLSLPYPTSSYWREMKQRHNEAVLGVHPDGKPIRGSKGVIERLTEYAEKYALLLRVRVQHTDPWFQSFASFGAGAQGIRQWAALPEVLSMARYSSIHISGGFYTDAGSLDIPDRLKRWREEYSYARALLAENIWVAMSSPAYAKTTPGPLDAYMRAYDRVACLGLAEHLARSGYVVGSFGIGRVVVFVRPGELPRLARCAIEAGALPPVGALSEEVMVA